MLSLLALAAASSLSLLAPADLQEQAKLRYESPPSFVDANTMAGDLVVLDPSGKPVENATVALLAIAPQQPQTQRRIALEVVLTDSSGVADLSNLEHAEEIVVWHDNWPVLLVVDDLFAVHDTLHGNGPMIVEFEPTDVIAGTLVIDGASAPGGTRLSYMAPMGEFRFHPLDGPRGKALAKWDPPGIRFETTVGPEGRFRFDGFRIPEQRSRRPDFGQIRWPEESLFRVAPKEGQQSSTLYERKRFKVPEQHADFPIELKRGGWLSGRILGPTLQPLGSAINMRYRGATPAPETGETEEERGFREARNETVNMFDYARIQHSGTFRFAHPLPFSDMFFLIDPSLQSSPIKVRVPAPPDDVGSEWNMGDLVLKSDATVLLAVQDESGHPIEGAFPVELDANQREIGWLSGELPRSSSSHPIRRARSSSLGLLVIDRPQEGNTIRIDHELFESVPVRDFQADGNAVLVTMKRGASLLLTGELPAGLLMRDVLVQIEAQSPARRLDSSDRPRLLDSNVQAGFMIDAKSKAEWSFTSSFCQYDQQHRAPTDSANELGDQPTHIHRMVPGVPFHLRVLEPTGQVFFEGEFSGLGESEQRVIPISFSAPLAPLRGRVVDLLGKPRANVKVHFGKDALTWGAYTDLDGHFSIDGAYSRTGRLLIDSTSYYTDCWGTAATSGRTVWVHDYRPSIIFPVDKEVVFPLPEPEKLTAHLITADGEPARGRWQLSLLDESETLLLGSSTYFHPTEYYFTRPGKSGTWLVARLNGLAIRQWLPGDQTSATIEVPELGDLLLDLDSGWEAGDNVSLAFRFCPTNGDESHWRSVGTDLGESLHLELVPPGIYSIQLFDIKAATAYAVAQYTPVAAPLEVEIVAGEQTEAAYH